MRRAGARRPAAAATSSQTSSRRVLRPDGSASIPSGDLIIESQRVARLHVRAARARAAVAVPGRSSRSSATSSTRASSPGMGGMGGGMALNQLLVVDGRHRQPAVHAALPDEPDQLVPGRDLHRPAPDRQRTSCACRRRARPARRSTSSARRTCPIAEPRPRAHAPGPDGPPHLVPDADQGRPQGHLRPLPRPRSRTIPTSTRPERRDEIARITNGYSPAMIDQICSMALTNAHHEGRAAFTWNHLVDAMASIESGTAVGIEYTRGRRHAPSRSTRPGTPRPRTCTAPSSSRAGCRSRCAAASLGHHQAFEKEERFGAVPERDVRRAHPRSSARWPPSSSSTARTRTASAATCSRRPGSPRRWSARPACRPSRSTSTARPSPTRPRSRRASAS